MSTIAAENHHNWQVEIGCHRTIQTGQVLWRMAGHGCLVHSRVVLTSSHVWEQAGEAYPPRGETMVRIGQTDYPCQLGHEDKERGLVALILSGPARDRNGEAFTSFPPLAEDQPQPGQPLALLKSEHLHSEQSEQSVAGGHYLCYSYGCVSLLRGKAKLLFGLSGVVWQQGRFGSAVFDEEGRIYGVSVDYLRTELEKRFSNTLHGYLIFIPVHSMAAATKRLALGDEDKATT